MKVKNVIVYVTATTVILTSAFVLTKCDKFKNKNTNTSSVISEVTSESSSNTSSEVIASSSSDVSSTISSSVPVPSSNVPSSKPPVTSSKDSTSSTKPPVNYDTEINNIANNIYNLIKNDPKGSMISKNEVLNIINSANGFIKPPTNNTITMATILFDLNYGIVARYITDRPNTEARVIFNIDNIYLEALKPKDKAFMKEIWNMRNKVFDAIDAKKPRVEVEQQIIDNLDKINRIVKNNEQISTDKGNLGYENVNGMARIMTLGYGISLSNLKKQIGVYNSVENDGQALFDYYNEAFIATLKKITSGSLTAKADAYQKTI